MKLLPSQLDLGSIFKRFLDQDHIITIYKSKQVEIDENTSNQPPLQLFNIFFHIAYANFIVSKILFLCTAKQSHTVSSVA